MPKRISWKKGMRLTDEVLIQADRCTSESFAQAFTLAAEGRFGLFPSVRPFQLALNVEQNSVNVESLDCLGITRAGDIIDVRFDTKFTNTFNTRVSIPQQEGTKEFILVIKLLIDSLFTDMELLGNVVHGELHSLLVELVDN